MTSNNATRASHEYMFDHIRAKLEVLGAIMALEYHDKNHLSGDNESRCRQQREIVNSTYRLVCDLQISIELNKPSMVKEN